MDRRTFLSLTSLSLTVSAFDVLADGGAISEYSPEAYQEAIASGAPVLLDWSMKS